MNKDIIKEFEEKYSKSPYLLQFKIHTGGFVNSDYKLEDATEDIKQFLLKALQAQKKELREKIRKIVDKADVPNWNAEDVSNAFNQLKEI